MLKQQICNATVPVQFHLTYCFLKKKLLPDVHKTFNLQIRCALPAPNSWVDFRMADLWAVATVGYEIFTRQQFTFKIIRFTNVRIIFEDGSAGKCMSLYYIIRCTTAFIDYVICKERFVMHLKIEH